MSQLATGISVGSEAIKSDPNLVGNLRRYGWFDATGCYQCGTCTIVCDLVKGSASFPRKIMRYAMLGLKEPLTASLEPWLCHDCGNCSAYCPREAEPRISIETLRRYLIGQYDWTGLASRIMRSRAWYLGSLGVATALVLGLIVLYHLWQVGIPLSDFTSTTMGLEHMFPTMTYFTLTVTLVPLLLLVSHAYRMWRFAMATEPRKIPLRHYLAEIRTYVVQSITQEKMRDCPEKSRWAKHGMMALGTVLMLVIIVFFLRWFQTDNIYPIYHPQRWVGYVATVMLLLGTGDVIVSRLRKKKEIYKHSDLRDLAFPILLFLTALSGIVVHIFRYTGLALASHYAYAIHIVITTPMLVVEIPFGKWSHMIYRPLALYLQAVKERARAEAPVGEVAPEHA